MLKESTAPGFSLIEKLLPSQIIEKFILKLPFNKIEKGIINLNLFGQTHRFEGKQEGHHAELNIVNPARAFWLIKTQGELGFAQAYYEGAIDTNSLYELLYVGYDNEHVFANLLTNKPLTLFKFLNHKKNHNSLENSRKNISYHYDLGNDFYSLWLDKTMSYSSALFNDDTHTMEQAQHNKYNHVLNNLNVKEGDNILEIGCGWGGLMEMALVKQAKVTGLTLSEEQKKFADHRLASQFETSDFEVKLQDYRLEEQQFDHIISIEMFEAVGKEYWDQYFETLNRCLKPGGNVGLQVITIADEYAESYQNSVDFIQAYIFPGGLLPSVKQLNQFANKHGFEITKNEDFGMDYGVTCQLWKQSFNKHAEVLQEKGYDKPFQRLWNYYLDYCTVGFETQHISVNQLFLQRIEEV